jgi:dTDP-4-amino-4,6-dideoxygalactose transaminase
MYLTDKYRMEYTINQFERQVAEFFGAPYSVATDSCTHGIELCLRYTQPTTPIVIPRQTYISIPMTLKKLGLPFVWNAIPWKEHYWLLGTQIIDAAVMWRRNSYQKGTYTVISFQYKKHLNLIRGGMILTDDNAAAKMLKKMSYDGRDPSVPWREQDIDTMGYHYYMPEETALLGLEKLPWAINNAPERIWDWNDYPDLPEMTVFK